jgi:hypothetical protein
MAKHCINLEHCILLHNISILVAKSRYKDHVIREATDIELCPSNMNKDGFCLSNTETSSLVPRGVQKIFLGGYTW